MFLKTLQEKPDALALFKQQVGHLVTQLFRGQRPTPALFFKDKFLSTLHCEVIHVPVSVHMETTLRELEQKIKFSLPLNELQWNEEVKKRFPRLEQNEGVILDVVIREIRNGFPVHLGVRSRFSTLLQPDSIQDDLAKKGYISILAPKEVQVAKDPKGPQHLVPKSVFVDRFEFLNSMGYFTELKDLEAHCLLVTPKEVSGLTENLVLVPMTSKMVDYLQDFVTPDNPLIELEFDEAQGSVYGLVSEAACQKMLSESERLQLSFQYLQDLKTRLHTFKFELVPIHATTHQPEQNFLEAYHHIDPDNNNMDVEEDIPCIFDMDLEFVCYLPRTGEASTNARFIPSSSVELLTTLDSNKTQYYIINKENTNMKPVLIEPFVAALPDLTTQLEKVSMDVDPSPGSV